MARLISLVEDGHPALREVMAALAPDAGRAHVVGVTGAPGVGKSTMTNALVTAYRARGRRVGVLAVDPSSPFSGAAPCSATASGCRSTPRTPRSSSARWPRGGTSAGCRGRRRRPSGCSTRPAATSCSSRPSGSGQSEVEVAGTADTTLVLLAPGMGDGIQAAKAGILEVADVLVVNKADRDGADGTVRDLRHAVSMADRTGPGHWRPPVVRTVATTGDGVEASSWRRSRSTVSLLGDRRTPCASGAAGGARDRGPRAGGAPLRGSGGSAATSGWTRSPPRSSLAAWIRMPRPTGSSRRSPESPWSGRWRRHMVAADHWQGWPPPDGSGLVGASGT